MEVRQVTGTGAFASIRFCASISTGCTSSRKSSLTLRPSGLLGERVADRA